MSSTKVDPHRTETPEVAPTSAPLSEAPAPWKVLLDAAEQRFPGPRYEVTCDDRHTVWVKLADGGRSVGLSQWLLRRFPLDELLQRAEARLEGRRASL